MMAVLFWLACGLSGARALCRHGATTGVSPRTELSPGATRYDRGTMRTRGATIMLMVLSCVFHFGVRPVMGVADWDAERRLYEVTSRMSPLTWVLLAAGVAATLV